MRDAVELERRGVPTVTISHHVFESAARAQARALGLAELAIAPVPQPSPWETLEDERKKAEDLFPTIIKSLLQPVSAEA